jgi:hypothetical protein
MKIVYIHGRAQQGKAANLKSDWDTVLTLGFHAAGLSWPARVTSEAPFYGDILAKATDQADEGDVFGLVRLGPNPAQDRAKREFYRQFLLEIAAANGISEEQIAAEETEPVPLGFENWRLINGLLRKLNEIQAVADLSIERYTRDVFYYLEYQYIRQFVDKIIEDGIPAAEPCVVVSHSLGTIVAYNVLARRVSAQGGGLTNVRAWITLGSPLGVQAVYDRLPSGGGPRRAPFGIPEWYNARDPVDVVALHPIPDTLFAHPPAVENSSHVKNQTSNHHGIEGYLNDPKVARRIYLAVS